MADSKISSLSELTSVADNDELVIVDKSDTSMAATGTNKRVKPTTLASRTETLTNKTIDADSNTISNLEVDNIKAGTLVIKSEGIAANDNDTTIPTSAAVKDYVDANSGGGGMNNLLKNGNFINNSTNGYGSTPDDWTASNANPVQGGFPSMTKQQLIDLLGISDGDIEGLWNLNEASGNAIDLSSNGYTLTDNNTVGSSDDGLMAKARDFEAGNSEYLSIAGASSGNLNITGSQTFFSFIKLESLPSGGSCVISLGTATGGNEKRLFVLDTGKVLFQLAGLTTNSTISSDVTLETGKWYLLVGKYDSVAQLLSITINGIKKSVTSSGTTTSVSADRVIGASETKTGNFFDGLIQNAGVLSVALTDAQVKKLFAATLYRGQKIRRATTDAYLSQTLPEDLVERLRGKEVSIVGKAYQEVASTAQVSIDDGTETASTTSATTGSWIDIGATKTISATATSITIKLKHSTSDGNSWFKEIAFYEGGTLVYVWYPSYDDISRFPRLLKVNPPADITGYQYEENRVFSFSSFTITSTTMTMGTVSGKSGSVIYNGITARYSFSCTQAKTGTGTTYGVYITTPYVARTASLENTSIGVGNVDNMFGNSVLTEGSSRNNVQIRTYANMTADGVGRGIAGMVIAEID